MAEAAVEALFHPDRIRGPLRRTGRRGSGEWEQLTLEDASNTISERLKSLREKGEPHKLAILTRDRNQLLTRFFAHFMKAFGSPNFFCVSDFQIPALPARLTQGLDEPPVYDFRNADLILNFGGDFLDEPDSPVSFNQIYSGLRNRQGRLPATVLHVASYMSRTAANSTEWIPIVPGTMAALALSIAHVMLKDGTYDREFLEQHSFGFRRWTDQGGKERRGVEALILEQYYPEGVARLTGVPADRIVEIARAFSSADTAIAIPGSQAAFATNGLYTTWAIYCLNALKGNLGKRGGVLFPVRLPSLFEQRLKLDSTGRENLGRPPVISTYGVDGLTSLDSVDKFVRALDRSQESPIDTLVIQGIDPLYETTLREKCLSVLKDIPFIVSFSPFMNEVTGWADLVLPEPTPLERWEGSDRNSTVPYNLFSVQTPVVEPLYESVHAGDFTLELARKLGGSVAESCPWQDYPSLLKSQAERIFDSGEGTLVSESAEYAWIESLRERGWQAFSYTNADEFWDLLVEHGGWWSPQVQYRTGKDMFRTRSGKFEFHSLDLARQAAEIERTTRNQQGQELQIRQIWELEADGDLVLMPHYEAPRFASEKEDFPLHLFTFQGICNPNGEGRHLRMLREISGLHSREYWLPWVEINPETARRLGIGEEDHVFVTSPKGRLRAKAKLVPTVMPDVAVMPEGMVLREMEGREGSTRINPREIFAEDADWITGLPSLVSTKVSVEKVLHDSTET